MTLKPVRMRLVKEAILELKEDDPKTAITEYRIGALARDGKIRSIRAGWKLLINYDDLLRYLAEGDLPDRYGEDETGKIHKIV